MTSASLEFRRLPDAAAVACEAAARVLERARRAIAAGGRFRLVLAGGSTPIAAYRLLAGAAADWSAWEVFFGDERCLAVDDPGRNGRAAREAWLAHVPISAEAIHEIPAELGAKAAATRYDALVAQSLPFDLVLLGMGEDGHTASLFPGRAIPEGRLAIPVHEAPKPPPERVSLTPAAFAGAGEILTLVTGAGKREAVRAWRAGIDLPIARAAAAGPSLALLDAAAWGEDEA
ncbi:6-phosphogluconolactonase [Thiococcus pfennigii]|jgi:6-phosphogluconolactonase|uniref:6-phosphogluconolactonase n=1 Tax=Thiococcus pfennigii TaxID=1057 RepID=UPI0019060CCC|nr:6-phosphogluconolactonase [Thiococcus pfennigii]MBK1699858.1 6-phosphogluconolactonase [Thiococcus pfennigii]MBK1733600.1 6-phosphogluconolactonase [Thiococcus pfennigii]